MHLYFNQKITHITTHVQESVNASQMGKLLQGSAEAFWLELGLSFTLGTVKYNIVASSLRLGIGTPGIKDMARAK